ncbi:MAG: hypothetical protein AAB866_02880 [Patescibacteria group bacterium]
MTNTPKIVLIIAVIIVLGMIWFWYSGTTPTPSVPTPTTATNTVVDPQANTTIEEDLASVDAQLGSFNENMASVDEAINDTPITQ